MEIEPEATIPLFERLRHIRTYDISIPYGKGIMELPKEGDEVLPYFLTNMDSANIDTYILNKGYDEDLVRVYHYYTLYLSGKLGDLHTYNPLKDPSKLSSDEFKYLMIGAIQGYCPCIIKILHTWAKKFGIEYDINLFKETARKANNQTYLSFLELSS